MVSDWLVCFRGRDIQIVVIFVTMINFILSQFCSENSKDSQDIIEKFKVS